MYFNDVGTLEREVRPVALCGYDAHRLVQCMFTWYDQTATLPPNMTIEEQQQTLTPTQSSQAVAGNESRDETTVDWAAKKREEDAAQEAENLR